MADGFACVFTVGETEHTDTDRPGEEEGGIWMVLLLLLLLLQADVVLCLVGAEAARLRWGRGKELCVCVYMRRLATRQSESDDDELEDEEEDEEDDEEVGGGGGMRMGVWGGCVEDSLGCGVGGVIRGRGTVVCVVGMRCGLRRNLDVRCLNMSKVPSRALRRRGRCGCGGTWGLSRRVVWGACGDDGLHGDTGVGVETFPLSVPPRAARRAAVSEAQVRRLEMAVVCSDTVASRAASCSACAVSLPDTSWSCGAMRLCFASRADRRSVVSVRAVASVSRRVVSRDTHTSRCLSLGMSGMSTEGSWGVEV